MDENKESVATIEGQGNKIWKNAKGEIHRLDGPAVEWATGHKEWWVNGQKMTEDEREKSFSKREVDSSGIVPFVKGTAENVLKSAQINGWKVYSHLEKNVYFSCAEEDHERVYRLLNS